MKEMRSNAKSLQRITMIISFLAKTVNKLGIRFISDRLFYFKNKLVLNYLNDNYGDYIDNYFKSFDVEEKKADLEIIWICWLQGVENAPDLVKRCISTIEQHKNHAEVRVVNLENVEKYVSIPEYVKKNLKMGFISYTHFSDIIRFLLLDKYGGMWIDSTFFITRDIPDDYFRYRFFSGAKHIEPSNRKNVCISDARWVTSFLASGMIHYRLFSFLKDILLLYEQKSVYFVDYLLIDYLIYIAYKINGSIKADIDEVPYNNEEFSWLYYRLNKPFDKVEWQHQIMRNTFAYKLSNKRKWKSKCLNKTTFYGKLIEEVNP